MQIIFGSLNLIIVLQTLQLVLNLFCKNCINQFDLDIVTKFFYLTVFIFTSDTIL